jgi:hypothetical protein
MLGSKRIGTGLHSSRSYVVRVTTTRNEVHSKTVQAADPEEARKVAVQEVREEYPEACILLANETESERRRTR